MEQEKREQVKQSMLPGNNLNAALPPLSDLEFERLKADVLSESSQNLLPTQGKKTFHVRVLLQNETYVNSSNECKLLRKAETDEIPIWFILREKLSHQSHNYFILPRRSVIFRYFSLWSLLHFVSQLLICTYYTYIFRNILQIKK